MRHSLVRYCTSVSAREKPKIRVITKKGIWKEMSTHMCQKSQRCQEHTLEGKKPFWALRLLLLLLRPGRRALLLQDGGGGAGSKEESPPPPPPPSSSSFFSLFPACRVASARRLHKEGADAPARGGGDGDVAVNVKTTHTPRIPRPSSSLLHPPKKIKRKEKNSRFDVVPLSSKVQFLRRRPPAENSITTRNKGRAGKKLIVIVFFVQTNKMWNG